MKAEPLIHPFLVLTVRPGRRSGVKLTPMIYEHRGWDGHKNVNGRKRQLVVDSSGRLWVAKVHAANQADGVSSVSLVADIASLNDRLEKVFGDQAASAVRLQRSICPNT